MNWKDFDKLKRESEEKIISLLPNLKREESGIYVFSRFDKDSGLSFAYIGQAVDLLQRLSQHLNGFSHIDLSIKKRGLKNLEKNGEWDLTYVTCAKDQLDTMERAYIKYYGTHGYQLYNETIGGQNAGKIGIGDGKCGKGYQEGLKNGYQNCREEVKEMFAKYLDFVIKGESGKIKERKFEEFKEWINND